MAEFGGLGWKLLPAAQKAGCSYFVHFHGYDASKKLNSPNTVRQYQTLFEQAQSFFTITILGGQIDYDWRSKRRDYSHPPQR